jgi:NAD+ diphosphatase
MSFRTFFSGGDIDRAGDVRTDPAAVVDAWHAPATRFVAIWQSRCMIADDNAVLLTRAELSIECSPEQSIYLGQTGDQHLFAVSLPAALPADGPDESAFGNFRGLLGNMSERDAALLAYAKGMVEWQERHRYCGHCGAPNKTIDGGFVMQCSAEGCGTRSFPRLDPAIIVLTTHEDRALLGQQEGWPDGRYSTIAGFVEPGESLEDAVRREVREETNIEIDSCHYLASQPWPFPNAIMLGFRAVAATTDIRRNDGELADAQWFSREQLTSGDINLPPPQSIAFRLIENWFDEGEGPGLQSYDLSTDFRRTN